MKAIAFETKQACVDFLRSLENYYEHGAGFSPDRTHLFHGEYSAPNYKPRKYKDGWGIRGEFFYNAGTIGAPKEGRCNAVKCMSGRYRLVSID